MAAPVDAGRNTTNVTASSDPWTVNLPGTIGAGNLLVLYARAASAVTFNTPSDWTVSTFVNNDTSDASDDVTSMFWKVATGSEGATLSLDLSAAAKGAALCWRITGADTTVEPDEEGAVGTGANANPPAITPPGGSSDYLFLACIGLDGETQTFTQPSGYSNLIQANSGTGGAASTNVRLGGASVQRTGVSTEDAGAWTHAAPSSGWLTNMFAVEQSAVPASLLLPNQNRRIVRR